jgi:hypothetical protein
LTSGENRGVVILGRESLTVMTADVCRRAIHFGRRFYESMNQSETTDLNLRNSSSQLKNGSESDRSPSECSPKQDNWIV